MPTIMSRAQTAFCAHAPRLIAKATAACPHAARLSRNQPALWSSQACITCPHIITNPQHLLPCCQAALTAAGAPHERIPSGHAPPAPTDTSDALILRLTGAGIAQLFAQGPTDMAGAQRRPGGPPKATALIMQRPHAEREDRCTPAQHALHLTQNLPAVPYPSRSRSASGCRCQRYIQGIHAMTAPKLNTHSATRYACVRASRIAPPDAVEGLPMSDSSHGWHTLQQCGTG